VIFGSWILYLMTAFSVVVLRKKRPDLQRPYRVLGYPAVPVLFVIVALFLLSSTLHTRPRESIMGLGLMALGTPFYFFWKRRVDTTLFLEKQNYFYKSQI
jgi:basic amino acid/polyamine antiporter, APA family